jgi:aryl-alcohol dehydrogenase-like predicted oxidoreductase
VRDSSNFHTDHHPNGSHRLVLMTSHVPPVDRAGARVTAAHTNAGRLSRIILSARNFEGATRADRPAERAERLRTLIADAIERGVTHIEVGRGDGTSEDLLHACAEPALVKRFGIISRVAPRAVEESNSAVTDGLAVEASVERTFATLGRRGVDVLVFPDSVAAARGWQRALAYREEGAVSALGLVAESPADLDWALAEPDLAYVEVRGPGASEGRTLTALHARGCVLAVETTGAELPPWATSGLVTAIEPAVLDAAITAAAGQPVVPL